MFVERMRARYDKKWRHSAFITKRLKNQFSCACHHVQYSENFTILTGGYLGSPNDEERSEMRYVMRIAGLSESSKL